MYNSWWRNLDIQVVLWVSFLSILGYGAQRAILPWHMSSLGIDPALAGVFLSFFGPPRAMMNIVGGYLTDTFRRKVNFLLGVALYGVVGYVVLAFSLNSAAIAVSRVLIGLGLAWGTTAAMAVLSDYSTQEVRGTVFGVQKGFFWVGIALSGYMAVVAYNRWGFMATMLLSAGLGCLSLVLIGQLMSSCTPAETGELRLERRNRGWMETFKALARDPRYTALSFGGLLAKIVEDGLVIVLLPMFFAGSVVAAGLAVTAFTVAFAVFQPFGGALSDGWGRKRVITGGMVLTIIGAALLINEPGTVLIVISSFVMGVGVAVLSPAAEAMAGDLAAERVRATAIGYWRFQRDMGSFWGPLILPVITLSIGKDMVLFILIVLLMTSGVACARWLPGKAD